MMPRKAIQFWLPAFALAAMVSWYGCEQKGDISPTGTGRSILTFIDTVGIYPNPIGPGDTATVETRILTETMEPATGEDVRFSVTRGTLGSGTGEVTVRSDGSGYARTRFTAPQDTGSVLVRTELLSMSEMRTATVHVSSGTPNEGLLTIWADADSLFADNGVSSTHVYARLRNATNNPIGGATIYFSTNIGTVASPSVTDNITGVAQTTLVSTTEAGQAAVIARYGAVTDTAHILFLTPYEASQIIVSSSRPNLPAGADTARITAYVFDEGGFPVVDNTVVSFSTTRGQLTAYTGRTIGGVTVTTLIAGPTTGEAIVAATTGGEVTGNVTVQIDPGPPADITLTAAEDTLVADGNAETTITAAVWDNFLNPAGQQLQVTFTATGGTVVGSATVGPDGQAVTTFRAGLDVGPATVVAAIAGAQRILTLHLIGTAPASISLTVDPNVLEANGTSQSSLRALVLDGQNQPVSNGTSVTFTSEYGVLTGGPRPESRGGNERSKHGSAWSAALDRHQRGGGAGTFETRLSERTIRLDETTSTYTASTIDGYAYAILTSPTTVATDHIVASSGALSDTAIVNYVTGIPATLILTAQSDTLQANGIAIDSITAHVTDAAGHELANVEVLFDASIGNITVSRVTDSNGDAKVAFTSSQTGTAQISAMAGSAQDFYTIYLVPGAPNSIQLTYFPNSVGVRGSGRNETLLVTAMVRDASNNPVLDGTPVVFNINGSPGGGDFLSSTDPVPTINGEASVSYSSGTISGSVRIRAVCEDVSALSTEILIYAGPPYIEDIADGCLTSHMSLSATPCSMFGMDFVGDSVRLTVLIGDRYNNPVPAGTAVYFTTSGGVITTNTGYTDDNGFAHVTLYSGSPLPTVSRWLNTLSDPNNGGPILCSPTPTQDGMAKVVATSAGMDANGDSVTVWAATNVVFDYRMPYLAVREVSVNGDPNLRELYIGENALITIAAYDPNYWPLVDSSLVNFTANAGQVYPESIVMGCPGDTSYTVSFFNNLTIQDDDVATPVQIVVDTRQGDAYTFTETLTLRASLPPDSLGAPRRTADNHNGN